MSLFNPKTITEVFATHGITSARVCLMLECQELALAVNLQGKYRVSFETGHMGFRMSSWLEGTNPTAVNSRFMGTLVKLAGKVQTVTIHVSGVKNGVTTRLRNAIEHWNDDEVQPFGALRPDDRATLKRRVEPGEPLEVVTYKGTWLGVSDELLNQLHAGYEVEEIGLEYPPAAMSFRLTHQFRFKGIHFAEQEPEDGAGEGDDTHDWRMMAMREVEGLVAVVNELCALMECEQPTLEPEGESEDGTEGASE